MKKTATIIVSYIISLTLIYATSFGWYYFISKMILIYLWFFIFKKTFPQKSHILYAVPFIYLIYDSLERILFFNTYYVYRQEDMGYVTIFSFSPLIFLLLIEVSKSNISIKAALLFSLYSFSMLGLYCLFFPSLV